MLLATLSIILGFVLLIKGADWLVTGASSIARRMRISELVIGLTVVSFGTSAPELIVNIFASFQGSADIAIGNIVGSNISNTLLILGITAIIAPLLVQRSTVLKQIPFNLLAACTLFIMANDMLVDGYAQSELSRSDGLAFLAFFVIFLYYTFGIRHVGHEEEKDEHEKPKINVWVATSLVVLGCFGLAVGGKLVVDGAITIARIWNVSEAFIGLTIVAIGTSLPELAASAVAAYKGRSDIAVGNIVGSNIFNIFWILGISSVIKPLPFQPSTNFDLLMVVLSTALLFFLVHNGKPHRRLILWWRQSQDYIIRRWEGVILLSCYICYIAYIGWRG
ncbi:MAG: calcium/sodium antiporter [Candidatus Peribacteraceae bacterium]|jgi:cation:H+ antiporter|nr:calcium/sodium antiporter [Candidatus Peribacteraceae bacterium]HCI03448.1 sodium:proton exchanger [Candidatus Peribacteria bacterium]|tara:strand:+ start:3896 stop:4900 length:1005 start_codon:yes stop_codon:yes gene_type:complete